MARSRNTKKTVKKLKKLSPKQLLLVVILAVILTVVETQCTGGDTAAPTPSALSGETSVHFLDVGQGDATLFLSGEQAVLIDASVSGASDTIISYLDELGVDTLDAVIATHPHADHIGGMRKVIEAVKTETIYMSNGTSTTQTYDKLLTEIEEQNIELIVPEIGDVLTLDSGATFTFLSPDPNVNFDNLNNYSLVCMFEAGGTRVLMTGDAEAEIEEHLVASGVNLDCDILKVGHHGSNTSSSPAFLKAASPETAVISCAKENDYGHPHRETLEALAALGVDDIRYTFDGTVTLRIETTAESEAS